MASQNKTWQEIWEMVEKWWEKNPYYTWTEQKARIAREIRKHFSYVDLDFRVIWKEFEEWFNLQDSRNEPSWKKQEKKIKQIVERQINED